MSLGDSYDLSIGAAPVDLSTAAVTGKRLSMQEVSSVDIVVVKGAGTAGDDPVLTLREHDAAASGNSADLAVITEYWLKTEDSLDGDETWTRVTQSASASITDPGGAGTSAEAQQIIVVKVRADQLTAGCTHISLNVADVGTNAQLGTVLYILHPADHAAPTALPAPLR